MIWYAEYMVAVQERVGGGRSSQPLLVVIRVLFPNTTENINAMDAKHAPGHKAKDLVELTFPL